MSQPKDRIGKTLRKCLKVLKAMHTTGGGMSSDPELEALIKEVEKAIVYREI